MTPELDAAWEAWLQARPPIIRELAERFPPSQPVLVDGLVMYPIAYSEGGGISVTSVDPADDYDLAVESRQPICANCLHKLCPISPNPERWNHDSRRRKNS